MRWRLGHCGYFVLAALTAFAEPQILSYQELLDSWNNALLTRFPNDYQYQETLSDVVSWLRYTSVAGSGSYESPVLQYPYRYFSTSGMLSPTFYTSRATVAIQYSAERIQSSSNPSRNEPAGFCVCFSNAIKTNGFLVVSSSNIWPQEVFYWPSPWDWIRESISAANSVNYGELGHLPISLQILTYPGFSEWATNHLSFTSSYSGNGLDDRGIRLRVKLMLWTQILSGWAPTVFRATGYEGSATNYVSSVPQVQFNWTPINVSGEVYAAPFYPGPLWYLNNNRINADGNPDYILSNDALQLVQDEFDSPGLQGETNPFGNPRNFYYVVCPADFDGVPHFNLNFRLLATVKRKQ